MPFDEWPIQDEQVNDEEVWSAICYLDPDEQARVRESNVATVIAVLALLLIVCVVWVLIWLQVRGL